MRTGDDPTTFIVPKVEKIRSLNLPDHSSCLQRENFTFNQIKEEWDGQGMWHVWDSGVVYAGFLFGNLKEREHLQYVGVGGMIILKWIFKK